jgi:hypothetical protein
MQLLHDKIAAAGPSAAAVDVVVVSPLSLQSAATSIAAGIKLSDVSGQLVFTNLVIGGQTSRVRFAQCSNWAEARSVHNPRVLWISALDSHLGQVISSGVQPKVVGGLLGSFLQRPQLYPPLSWRDFEHKDRPTCFTSSHCSGSSVTTHASVLEHLALVAASCFAEHLWALL